MNVDISQILPLIKTYSKKALRHAKFIFIVAIIISGGFLVFEINRLTSREPSSEQVAQQLEIIKKPSIDQETINKIEELKDRNIAVQALFKSARDNPFQD